MLGLFAGGSGAGQWRQFLLWRHRSPFGTKDPYFHKDVGFYVFDLPWLHYLVDFGDGADGAQPARGRASCTTCSAASGCRPSGDKLSGAAQVQISVLVGLFVLFKAVDYWLDRFDLTTDSGGLFTGINYTDQQRRAARPRTS